MILCTMIWICMPCTGEGDEHMRQYDLDLILFNLLNCF